MGAIMNTTAAKKDDFDHGGKAGAGSHHGGPFLLLVFALLALALGLPRLIGGLHALAARETVGAVMEGASPPAAALEAAAAELAAAERWSGAAEHKLDRGLALLRQALAAIDPQERAALFAASEQATAAGLATAPGEPGAWARLAWLRQRRGDLAGAVAALRMSWLSGAFVPVLMTSRLELALSLQPALDDEMLSLLRRQIRLVWVSSPDFIAGLATRPEAGALISAALSELSEQDVARYLELHGSKR